MEPKQLTSGNPVYQIFFAGQPDDWKSGLDGLDKSAYGVILDEQQHLSFEEETFDITPTKRMDGYKIATMWKGWELFFELFESHCRIFYDVKQGNYLNFLYHFVEHF